MPSLEDLTTDQLLAEARAGQSAKALLETLSADPATRAVIQKTLKAKNPNMVIPELDARDAVTSELKTRDEKIAALEQELIRDRVEKRIERERAQIKERYGFSEADIAAVEALMTDKDAPIPSYAAAAKVHAASKQSAVPTTSRIDRQFSMPGSDMGKDNPWAEGIGNPAKLNKVALAEAFKAFNEITGGKGGQLPAGPSNLGPATTS